jgi:hypothetical protein
MNTGFQRRDFQRKAMVLTAALVLSVSVVAVGRAQGSGQQDQQQVQPQGQPRYGAPQSAALVVPQGTVINMRMDSTLNSADSHVGDKFTATVATPVYVSGKTAIPAGSTVEGQVTAVTPAKKGLKSGVIAVDFDYVVLPDGTRIKLIATLTASDPSDRVKMDQEGKVTGDAGNKKTVFIGGGGAVGALAGVLSGHGAAGMLGGAIMGAAVGATAVMLSKGVEAEVRAGTPFGIQLSQDLPITQGDPEGGYTTVDREHPAPPADQAGPPPQDRSYPNQNYAQQNSQDNGRPAYNGPAASSSQPSEPRDSSQPASQPAGQPTDQPSGPPSANSGEANQPDADLPLTSPEMISRAQVALRDQGYYEGQIDGNLSPRTQNSIKTYQHDHQLPETGNLDQPTAQSLGILGGPNRNGGYGPASPAGNGGYRQNAPSGGSAQGQPNGQPNTPGYGGRDPRYSDPADSTIAYPRGGARGAYTPQGGGAPPQSGGGGDYGPQGGNGSPQGGNGGSGQQGGNGGYQQGGRGGYGPPDSGSGPDNPRGPSDATVGRNIRRDATDLLEDYQRMIGVRVNDRGVESGRSSYNSADMTLLFALNDFANASRLYVQLSSTADPGSQRGLVLALARDARRADKVVTTVSTSAAQQIAGRWDAIRQNVLRLMDAQNIKTSEIEE